MAMKIACIGGGAAGLYFAISMKLRDPAHEIHIIERNAFGNTFGWGVVFSDATIQNLRDNDPATAQETLDSFALWDDIDVHFKGTTITSGGHGFCGIAWSRMLDILQRRAAALGIPITYETEVESLEPYLGYDLVVAADGINSRVRDTYAKEFQPSVDVRKNRFIWLGTHHKFDAFILIFIEADHVNSILAAGRADLCALARPHLANPNWTLHAAAELRYGDVAWPNPYLTGKEQLERLTERAQQMAQMI